MKVTIVSFALCWCVIWFTAPRGFAVAQVANDQLEKRVAQFADQGNNAAIASLIDAQETVWKTSQTEYFHNVYAIARALFPRSNAQEYWLGRKAIWNLLLKPVPNELDAARHVSEWKRAVINDAEAKVYHHINDEMFVSLRHDTFLMMSEYARQLRATIIPNYRDKWQGAMNDSAEKKRLVQNRIDNQVQFEARMALRLLAEDGEEYITQAYKHPPRDDEELTQLLDNLAIQGVHRERIIYWVTGKKGPLIRAQDSAANQ